jgi:hypothetical protein
VVQKSQENKLSASDTKNFGNKVINGPSIDNTHHCNSDLFKLGRRQLKMIVAILTGHAPVRGRLRIMDLFNGDPFCRFCGIETETVQHITCCCEVLAGQRYTVFGKLFVEP